MATERNPFDMIPEEGTNVVPLVEQGEAGASIETESTSETLASEAPALRHLYSEFIQKAHDAGYTNDEIKEFIANI